MRKKSLKEIEGYAWAFLLPFSVEMGQEVTPVMTDLTDRQYESGHTIGVAFKFVNRDGAVRQATGLFHPEESYEQIVKRFLNLAKSVRLHIERGDDLTHERENVA